MRRVNSIAPPFPPDDLRDMTVFLGTNMLVPENYAACNVYERGMNGPIVFYAWTIDGFRVFCEFDRRYWMGERSTAVYLVKKMFADALGYKCHASVIYLAHTAREWGRNSQW